MNSNVSRTESAERTFDQAWPMVHQAIDELWKRGRIRTSVIGLPVGSLFHASGVLSVVDLHLLQSTWGPLSRQFKKSNPKAPSNSDLASMGDFAKAIAVPIVCQLFQPGEEPTAEGVTTWGALKPENLLSSPDTFALMSGGILPGTHHVIGILDYGLMNAPDIDKFLESFSPSNTFEMMLVMQQLVRSMFGRPNYANGMTPLVIYRELTSTGTVVPV